MFMFSSLQNADAIISEKSQLDDPRITQLLATQSE